MTLDTVGTYQILVIADGECTSDTCFVQVQLLEPAAVSCGVVDTTLLLCQNIDTVVNVPVMIMGDDLTITITPESATLENGIVSVPVTETGTTEVQVIAGNSCSSAIAAADNRSICLM